MSKQRELTIKQAQNEVRKFLYAQGKEWTQTDNHFYMFTHLAEEIGELARHIITSELRLDLNRTSKKPMRRKDVLSLIQDDLGDILYHLFKIAVAYNLDLNEGFKKAMHDIRTRYAVS